MTLAWMFLSAVGSGLLVSFTSRMTQDIAPIPMLWIIPLSLYLLTFIVCFGGMYRRDWILPLALHRLCAQHLHHAALRLVGPRFRRGSIFGYNDLGQRRHDRARARLERLLPPRHALHGELYALRPAARFLSRYYLVISAGGALGGAFVSLAAPFLFKVQLEYPLLLALALGVSVDGHARPRRALVAELLAEPHRHHRDHRRPGSGSRLRENEPRRRRSRARETKITYYRNIYGPMRVEDGSDRKSFLHGTTTHGTQLTEPNAALRPISYYSDQSAVGIVYRFLTEDEKRNPLRIGAIGLGVGTLAAYARSAPYADAAPGERAVIFYELDPEVAQIARTHFTYLTQGGSERARDPLRRRAAPPLSNSRRRSFDMLVVDAFTGDGIPIHLLTREALELYLRHIKAGRRDPVSHQQPISAPRKRARERRPCARAARR